MSWADLLGQTLGGLGVGALGKSSDNYLEACNAQQQVFNQAALFRMQAEAAQEARWRAEQAKQAPADYIDADYVVIDESAAVAAPLKLLTSVSDGD